MVDTFTDLNGEIRLTGTFTGTGLGVSSVFTRAGDVVAVDGDYAGVVSTAKTGATAATRFVGGVATVAPTTGTFAVGDFVISQNGKLFVCTVAGTPGTWATVASFNGGTITTPLTINDPITGTLLSVQGTHTNLILDGFGDLTMVGDRGNVWSLQATSNNSSQIGL